MARLGRKAALTALWNALIASRKGPSLGRRLGSLPRMIGATLRGRYDGRGRLFAMIFATLYIISPIDLIPEALFSVFGLVDDAAVAVWRAGAVLAVTERFLEWERRRATVIPGHARAQ